MSGRPIKRTLRDHVLFWNAGDLERQLADFQAYYNAARSHASLEGYTPLGFAGERGGLMTNSRPTGVPESRGEVGVQDPEHHDGARDPRWRDDRMTGRRSHGRLSALNGVVHQGSSPPPTAARSRSGRHAA